MKKYTLLGHVFELEENAHHFLARYIERIEQYAATHRIAHDVIDDIKYSIIEKLYRYETPITEKQVIEVANSLGEPEVIFDESDDASTEESKRGNIFTREKPVIWGVCYWLSKSLNIPVKVLRIIFFILIFAQGTGLILYAILALFVPYKDKKKTTGAIGNIFFEFVRVILWLAVLSLVLPLTFGALAVTGVLFFTPSIDNQSIQAWIPTYMYGIGIAMSIAFTLLSIGAIGALFKQRWLNKTLALLATIIIVVGAAVTIGTGYKTVMTAVSYQTNVKQEMILTGSTAKAVSGDRVYIDLSKINVDTDRWPYFGISNSDVTLVRTSGSDVRITVLNHMMGMSEEGLTDTASKLVPLLITGDANNFMIYREGKLFSSEVPLAGVQRGITIAVPEGKEIYIKRNWRMNMSVEDDNIPGTDYCGAKVYVYNEAQDEYICKQTREIDDIHFDSEDNFDDMDDMIENRIQQKMQEKMNERNAQQGIDAVPPMYPQE